MQQLSFFEEPEHGASRRFDPDTARDAAEELDATRLEAIVLSAIRRSLVGLTSSELVPITGLDRVTVSPRLRPLCRKELVYDSGERRLGPSGRAQIVWKAR